MGYVCFSSQAAGCWLFVIGGGVVAAENVFMLLLFCFVLFQFPVDIYGKIK